MTRSEAGRLGGNATLERHGTAHYQRMAHVMLAKYGTTHMRELGKKGGEAYNMRYVAGGKRGSIHHKDSSDVPY